MQTLLRYPDKDVQVYFEGTFGNARNGAMIEFMGTEGTLYLDRGRYEVIPERGKQKPKPSADPRHRPSGADFYDKPDGELLHLTNWIECIRDRRKKPTCPGRSRRQRRQRRAPGEPVAAQRASGDVEGVTTLPRHKRINLRRLMSGAISALIAGVACRRLVRPGRPTDDAEDKAVKFV